MESITTLIGVAASAIWLCLKFNDRIVAYVSQSGWVIKTLIITVLWLIVIAIFRALVIEPSPNCTPVLGDTFNCIEM